MSIDAKPKVKHVRHREAKLDDKNKRIRKALIRPTSTTSRHLPHFGSKAKLNDETYTASSLSVQNIELKKGDSLVKSIYSDSSDWQESSISGYQSKQSRFKPNELLKKFIKAVNLTIFCFKWSKWAYENYNRTIHRYISFAQFSSQSDDGSVDYSKLITYDKTEEDNEIARNAQVRAEMMNFDTRFFKSNQRLNTKLDNDAKAILSRPNKTIDDLNYLKSLFKSMSHMKSINSLPEKFKNMFLKRCWFEEYAPRRVVVSQDHKAESFYVIVSGSLVCTHRPDNERKSYTICFLEKGMTFGELPLMSDCTHTATVTTRQEAQLLVISKTDFFDIFLHQVDSSNGSGNEASIGPKKRKNKHSDSIRVSRLDEIPETESSSSSSNVSFEAETSQNKSHSLQQNLDYLSSLAFLRNWPIEQLKEKAKKIKNCIYPRGKIISMDSNISKYIYIVKQGSLSVLAKVKADGANSTRSSQDDLNKSIDSRRTEQDMNEASYFVRNVLMEEHHTEIVNAGAKLKEKSEDERYKELDSKIQFNHIMQFINDMKKVEGPTTKKYDDDTKISFNQHVKFLIERNQFVKNGNPEQAYVPPKLEANKITLPKLSNLKDTTKPNKENKKLKKTKFQLPDIHKSTLENYSDNSQDKLKKNKEDLEKLRENNNKIQETINYTINKNRAHFTSTSKPVYQAIKTNLSEILKDSTNQTISDDSSIKDDAISFLSASSKFKNDYNDDSMLFNSIELTNEYNKPQDSYLLIQKLFTGEHFGLADILFDAQPSMQLISNGCECILLPKDLFIEFSSIDFLKELRKGIAPFPKLEDIEHEYKSHMNWKKYTKKMLQHSLEKRSKKSLAKINNSF